MDKQDLERRLEAAEKQNIGLMDEIKNLKAKLADMQDEPEIPDFPEFKETGEETWHINNVLEVSTPGSTMGKVKFMATNSIHCDYGFVPFDTMENAQKCAEWLNKHWKENENE